MGHSEARWKEEAWWKIQNKFSLKKPQKPNRELSAYWPHLSFAFGTEEGGERERALFTF